MSKDSKFLNTQKNPNHNMVYFTCHKSKHIEYSLYHHNLFSTLGVMCQTCTDISIKCQCKYPVQSRTKLKEYRGLRIWEIVPQVNALKNRKKFIHLKLLVDSQPLSYTINIRK